MSTPPAFNPDTRPLPDGWISQYDTNYRTWYYVNTRVAPPVPSWVHPLGPPPPVPPPQYAPPPSAPPVTSPGYGGYGGQSSPNQYGGAPPNPNGYGYDNNQGAYSAYNGGGSNYPTQQQAPYGGNNYEQQRNDPYGGGYGQQQQAAYGQSAQGGRGGGGGLLGGLMGKLGGGHSQGGSPGYGGGYPQQQAVYQQAPPKKSGIGLGGLALAGGAGLVGGMLLEDVIDDNDRDDYRDDNNNDNNDWGNDDGGGGDW